jgi:hypothetical protein
MFAVLSFSAPTLPPFSIPSCFFIFLFPVSYVSRFPFPRFLMYPNAGRILKVLIMHIERVK